MKRHKRISVFLFGILVLLWAIACGESATPIAMGDIPVYPNAMPAEAGDNVMADVVIEAMEETAGEEEITIESKIFSLPAEATWADVKGFYIGEIAGTDWKPADAFTEESEGFSSIGWERGSGANEQALVIAYVPDLLGEGASLVILLFSE